MVLYEVKLGYAVNRFSTLKPRTRRSLPPPYQQPRENSFIIYNATAATVFFVLNIFYIVIKTARPRISSCHSKNFKLLRIILVEEGDWHAHHAEIIARDFRRPADFNRVVVVVLRIKLRRIFKRQIQRLEVSRRYVGKPAHVAERLTFARPQVENAAAVVNAPAQPHAAIFYQRENFLVRNGIDVADNDETFAVVHELRNIFSEQAERRVGDNNVSFAQDFNAFVGAEIAVTGECAGLDAARRLYQVPSVHARRYEFFKVERGEVVGEVAYELAVAEIVAVAVDDLATKKSAVLVTFEFALNVR